MENLKAIYAHLSPDKFSFSNELELSAYTFSDLPEYAKLSLAQSERFLGQESILLTNKNISEESHKKINEFYELCKQFFPSFYKDTFWLLTLIRLYVVYLYCEENNINEFIHLEYDNLIYSDLTVLKVLPPSIYFTRVGPYCSSAGFVYCNSLKSFQSFINKLKQLIARGEQVVRQFTAYPHLSEMIMLDLIYTHSTEIIKYLPILPEGVGSDNFNELNNLALFDGASYGQYLGGTNNGADKGWTGQHHYIGAAIDNKKIEVIFDKKPYCIFNGKKIDVHNLHIHSKNLKDFLC
jgi:hypothetical protein